MKRRGEPAVPIQRFYAIGDVHGRYDLFAQLVKIIQRDQSTRPPAATKILLLGNIIDRGPQSAEMVRGCMTLTASTDRFSVLKGSSEDLMVRALGGDLTAYREWLESGGRASLRSWGAERKIAEGLATPDNLRGAAATVGKDVLQWLKRLPLYERHPGYLFVHAGIRPGVAIERQAEKDLLWIADGFLRSEEPHGLTVVHGHSADVSGAVFRHNRIGIDTGAWRSDKLTAVGIEDDEVWTLSTATPLMAAWIAAKEQGRSGERVTAGYWW